MENKITIHVNNVHETGVAWYSERSSNSSDRYNPGTRNTGSIGAAVNFRNSRPDVITGTSLHVLLMSGQETRMTGRTQIRYESTAVLFGRSNVMYRPAHRTINAQTQMRISIQEVVTLFAPELLH